MSLTVFVLRSSLADATCGGVTSRETSFALLEENEEPEGAGPFLRLVKRRWEDRVVFHAVPLVERPADKVGPMAGGNFVYTSDSRWRDLVGHQYPIAVHDRFERPW